MAVEELARVSWTDELAQVERWRLLALIRAGYPVPLAERIAIAHDVDLHQAIDLAATGCPPELAARILL